LRRVLHHRPLPLVCRCITTRNTTIHKREGELRWMSVDPWQKAGCSEHHTCLTCREGPNRSPLQLSASTADGMHIQIVQITQNPLAPATSFHARAAKNSSAACKEETTSACPGNVLPCQGSKATSQNSPSWPLAHLGVHQKTPQFFQHPLSHGFRVRSY